MLPAIPAINAVASRIQTLEQRFGPEPRTSSNVVQSSTPFDPFGEAYQKALEQRPTAPASSLTTSSFEPGQARLMAEFYTPPGTVASTGSVTGASTGSATSTGAISGSPTLTPPELARFGNGQIPRDQLSPIRQNGHRLYAPAAASWDRLVDAAAADGLELRITDSYRSFEDQVDLARRKGLYSEGGLAAKPGTSKHGWGVAVDADVRDPAMLAWIREKGPQFGWAETTPREPWHWEYKGGSSSTN